MKKILQFLGLMQPDKTPQLAENKTDIVQSNTNVNDDKDPTGTIDVHGKIRDDGRIELKIDWDDDFIKMLKANGYNGANDEVIIQQYLTTIHRALMEDQTNGRFE